MLKDNSLNDINIFSSFVNKSKCQGGVSVDWGGAGERAEEPERSE